jgi:hypothetical protein
MTKATIAIESPPEAAVCPCPFNLRPETHDALLGIETAPPLDALELAATLAVGDVHAGWELGDFERFCAAHNWAQPAEVERVFSLFDDLADGYSRGCRSSWPV